MFVDWCSARGRYLMASFWFSQKNESSRPLAFRELVEWARSGRLHEDDLVRAEWESEWRPARSVVGLFYTARRSSSELTITATSRETFPRNSLIEKQVVEPSPSATEVTRNPQDSLEPVPEPPPSRWKERIQQVRDGQLSPPPFSVEPPRTPPRDQVRVLVEAAFANQQARQLRNNGSSRWLHTIRAGVNWLRAPWVFRLVCAGVLASATCLLTIHWGRINAMRFPRAAAREEYLLPLIGYCSRFELGIVLVDLAVPVAILGYFAAKRIELWADSR